MLLKALSGQRWVNTPQRPRGRAGCAAVGSVAKVRELLEEDWREDGALAPLAS